MKKISFRLLSFCTLILLCLMLVGCFGNNPTPVDPTSTEYTIQYTDELGQHTITVMNGSAYSIDSIPQKQGYTFTGLFDAEVGGTQYVNASGSALSVFTDNQNLILFPQFKANEYTMILDYQGAVVTGSRSMKVEYESIIGELPVNLSLENKEFTGWYTEPNRKGKQIADQYGVLPANNKVTEKNFNLNDADGNIYLYAGFKGKEYTVTFYAQDNNSPEEIKVEHGTPISEVVPSTRVNGQAVLSWSKTKGGEVFNGKVTDDMTLYAVDYAPYIELDCNGGNELNPIVARSGSTISLPIPTKDLSSFSHWEDLKGNKFTETIMPGKSLTLKAVWNPKIVFDENGGSDVQDISVKVGDNISLPISEKEGFVFAGWYTENKEKYTSSIMPINGIKLKAGWYKTKLEKIVKISSSEVIYMKTTKPTTDDSFNGLNSELLDGKWVNGLYFNFKSDLNIEDFYISIKLNFLSKRIDKSSLTVNDKMHFNFYSKKSISSAYLLDSQLIDINTGSYESYTLTTTVHIDDVLYICWYCNQEPNGYSNNACLKDLYYTITYPDTTNLYL